MATERRSRISQLISATLHIYSAQGGTVQLKQVVCSHCLHPKSYFLRHNLSRNKVQKHTTKLEANITRRLVMNNIYHRPARYSSPRTAMTLQVWAGCALISYFTNRIAHLAFIILEYNCLSRASCLHGLTHGLTGNNSSTPATAIAYMLFCKSHTLYFWL